MRTCGRRAVVNWSPDVRPAGGQSAFDRAIAVAICATVVVPMTNPVLAIVPLNKITLQITNEEDAVLGDLRRRDPVAAHQLDMAEALERVVREVAIPRPLDGTMQALSTLLDHAVMARIAANAMAAPAIQRRRPTHPGRAFGAAEDAAQKAAHAYRGMLRDAWPVTQWSEALRLIAVIAAREGAWELLAVVAEGLQGDPGSVEWWDAVVHCANLWGDRNYSREEPLAG